MREMTKSVMSFSWAMSLFGLRQLTCLLMPQSWNSASSSFDSVTRSTEDQLGSVTDSVFRAGDNLQRGLVDLMFSFLSTGSTGRNGKGRRGDGADAVRRSVQWGADVIQRSAEAGVDFVQRSAEAGADALRQSVGGTDAKASPNLRPEDVGWGPVPGGR